MDKQAILDRVIAFLHAQGGPGQQHNGCFYRTSDGRMSAIGCLIPDQLYCDGLEDCDPSKLPRYIFDAMDADTDDEIAFLVALETAHDLAAKTSRDKGKDFWSQWTTALRRIASANKLSLAILKSLGSPTESGTKTPP